MTWRDANKNKVAADKIRNALWVPVSVALPEFGKLSLGRDNRGETAYKQLVA
jgi:hypothetical protein